LCHPDHICTAETDDNSSFFYNDTSVPNFHLLSLHDALPISSLRMRSFGQLSRNDASAASASGAASRKSRMWGPALRPATTAFAGAGVGDGTGAWPLGPTQLASSESA